MRRKKTKILAAAVSASLIFCSVPADSAFAAIAEVNAPSYVSSFNSDGGSSGEYCRASVSGSVLRISFKTPVPSGEFRVALYGTSPKTEYYDLGIYLPATYQGISSGGNYTYGFDCSVDFADYQIPDGAYFLYLAKINDALETYETKPSRGALYKNLPIVVENGMPHIARYDDIIAENRTVRSSDTLQPSDYLDTTMEDVRFLFVNPKTKKREEMTPQKAAYFRQISDRITAGVYSDYDKLLKIYEYVAGNFYYDTVAFSKKTYQYANPYRNIYNHENRIASSNSDSQGRVATTCQGFSGIFMALARAEGIPTRLIAGHRATSPTYNWDTEGDPTTRDHWWIECYVNGRWIFIDPTVGTNNRWNRETDTWQTYGITNYTYFDPSEEQIAVSHIYLYIYKNKYVGWEINNTYETSMLTKFFSIYDGGLTNGKRLNYSYTPYNKKTWGDGVINNFYGDGAGKLARIKWEGFGLAGNADFSGFTKLKYLYLNDNNLSSLNVKGDSSLLKVDVSNNQLSEIDLTNCKKLTSVKTAGNKLTKAVIYASKRNTTITCSEHGYFTIKYTGSNKYKLRTDFLPDIGYKGALYNNTTGKKLGTGKSYHSMNPVANSYSVIFEPDPNSFRYLLKMYQNYGEYEDYNKASQERLSELGYPSGYADGYFDYEMKAAVERFQTDYLLPVTGEIDQLTWSILFDPNPTPLEPEPEPEPEPIIPEEVSAADQPYSEVNS